MCHRATTPEVLEALPVWVTATEDPTARANPSRWMPPSSRHGNNQALLPNTATSFWRVACLAFSWDIGTSDTGIVSTTWYSYSAVRSTACLSRGSNVHYITPHTHSSFVSLSFLRLASIWLTCHAQECTLELTPPGARTQTVVFSRTQLHGAQTTKVDKAGKFLSVDTSKYEPPPRGKNKKKKGYQSGAYKGPDESGMYRSYLIKFHPQTPSHVEKTEEDIADGDFSSIQQYLDTDRSDEGGEVYVLHMRKFGLAQSRTRIRSMVNKVESYIKRRRQKLLVKESAPLPWQGLLFLIFGLLGLMLTLIIGQFFEEAPRKQGGPGARRTSGAASSKKSKPTFVVDTGRPSKYPPGYKPGYNSNKKY
jgi:hypothetical protein